MAKLKPKFELKKIITAGVGVVFLAILGFFVPWAKVFKLLLGLKVHDLVILTIMATLYYTAKATRFWLMLKTLKYERPLGLVTLLYLSAQPATFMPGGEFYRTALLKERADIPIHRSSSAVVLQALVEAAALVVVGLIGALIIGHNIGPVLLVSVFFGLVIISLARGWVPSNAKVLNKLPLISISRSKLRRFNKDNQLLLKPKIFVRLLGLSLIPILAGIVIVYVGAHAVGVNFSWLQATIGYALPAIIAYVGFIPGTGEGGSIGILALLGVSLSPAVAITLLLRMFTVGAGLLLGPIAAVAHRKTKIGQL